ncbi:MAG: glutaredoxin family protein [Nannocystaceae bacterium]|nr:glutaredoxin [bacterium]
MTEPRKLTLYQFRGCPFCSMVERAIERLGVEVEMRDILRDSEAMQALVEATGRRTVPVLQIAEGEDAQWMPESRDIIAWLEREHAVA